jgi:hypothetical protein
MTEVQISPASDAVSKLVDGAKTLAELAKALAAPAPVVPEGLPFPDPAKPVRPTDDEIVAMRRLPKISTSDGLVQVAERRALTDDEVATLLSEDATLRAVAGYIDRRRKMIGETVRTHADAEAEASGRLIPRAQTAKGQVLTPASDRTKDGHYSVAAPQRPWRLGAPGVGVQWSLEYTAPSTSVSARKLAEMHVSGLLSREEFLACTASVRVLDEAKMLTWVRRSGNRGIGVLGQITETGAPGATLNLRKSDEG